MEDAIQIQIGSVHFTEHYVTNIQAVSLGTHFKPDIM